MILNRLSPLRGWRRVSTFSNDLYRRQMLVRDRKPRCLVQVVSLQATAPVETMLKYDRRVLEFDFRSRAVRADVGRTAEPRPGIYLHEELDAIRSSGRESLLLNGNNLGYWGNQYLVDGSGLDGSGLVWKARGPIFDDGQLELYASSTTHTFLCADRRENASQGDLRKDAFSFAQIGFSAGRRMEDSGVWLKPRTPELPRAAISGLPLLSAGKPVWRSHIADAWDPRLIFDGEAIVGKDRSGILEEFTRNTLKSSQLARHALTVVGLTKRRQLSVLVAEKSRRSEGLTIDQMAELASSVGLVDAIVLGAAGDAQIGSTAEGILVEPLVGNHVVASARTVPAHLLDEKRLRLRKVKARPVPCTLRFDLLRAGDEPPTARMRISPQTSPARSR